MKVAIIRAGSVFTQDGVNTFIFELSSAMLKKGINVSVLSGSSLNSGADPVSHAASMFDVDKLPEITNLSVKPFRNVGQEIIYWIGKGARALARLRPDVILMNGVIPHWSRAVRITVCHGLRNQVLYPKAQKCYDFLMYRTAHRLVAVSEPLKREIAGELGIKDVTVIPIGLNVGKHTPSPLSDRQHSILHVGTRLVKNLSTTLEAFKLVSRAIPEARLYITGDSVLYHNSQIAKNGSVFFLGTIPKKDLRGLYSKVMAVSAPSCYEAFHYGTLEAFASGTPVAASQAIPSQLLIDGFNGYRISKPDNHLELAAKLKELLLNKPKWKVMSANARATALKYDEEKLVKSYIDLIEQAMNC